MISRRNLNIVDYVTLSIIYEKKTNKIDEMTCHENSIKISALLYMDCAWKKRTFYL
jgi:hypothetical protein